MRRRTFLSALPVGVLATSAAQAQQPSAASVPPAPARPADPYAGIGIGDRISGPKFMGRSTVWGANGAAWLIRDMQSGSVQRYCIWFLGGALGLTILILLIC